MQIFCKLTAALLIAGSPGVAQNALTLNAPAPNPVAFASSTITGNNGNGSYCYWVVANYPAGPAFPTGPTCVQLAPSPLTGSNFVTISWTPTGATSYDVIEAGNATFPAPCSACKVGTTSGSSITDNGGSHTSYTIAPTGAAQASMSLNNINDAQPFINVQLINNIVNLNYRMGLVNGATSIGHCTQFGVAGTLVDAGGACNTGGGAVWGLITGTLSAQTDLQSALNLKAGLASPTFTGTPTAPTATSTDNTTKIATTAFVNSLLGSSPTLVTPIIVDFTNANHSHANAAGGGQLTNISIALANRAGAGSLFAMTSALGTSGNCANWGANGVGDSGAPCVSAPVHSFGATFDGGGVALTSGKTVYFTVPYTCTIAAWNIVVSPSGTATVDIWKIATGTAIPTIANTITASALPVISTGTAVHSTTLTGWTTAVTANDIFGINLNAVATATYVNLQVQCQ